MMIMDQLRHGHSHTTGQTPGLVNCVIRTARVKGKFLMPHHRQPAAGFAGIRMRPDSLLAAGRYRAYQHHRGDEQDEKEFSGSLIHTDPIQGLEYLVRRPCSENRLKKKIFRCDLITRNFQCKARFFSFDINIVFQCFFL